MSYTVDEAEAYGLSVRDWPAFEDSVEALRYLKQHYKLIILSNVDNRTFSYSNARLGVEFDAIYSAEDIGAYLDQLDELLAGYSTEQLAAFAEAAN